MAESKGDPHEYLNYMIVERGADKGEVFDYLQKFPLPTIAKDSVQYYEYRNTKKVLEALGSKKMGEKYTDSEIKEAISHIAIGRIEKRGIVTVYFKTENSEPKPVDTHFHSLNLLLKELNSYVENGFARIQKKYIARMDKKLCMLMGKRKIKVMGDEYYLTPSRYETVKKLLK